MTRSVVLRAFPAPAMLGKLGSMIRRDGWLDNYQGQYTLGRFANFWALKVTNLPVDTTAWLPAYHCGDEVQATLDAGFAARFFHVHENLEIDLPDLEQKIRSAPGPVLVIHYFGMPQRNIARVAELCRSLAVPLIEDCAHSLFSGYRGVALGDYGPLSVYSVRKTLGIYDGGLLRVDRQKYQDWMGAEPGPLATGTFSLDPYIGMLKMRARELLGTSITRLYHQLRWKGQHNRPRVIVGFDSEAGGKMSADEIARAYSRRMSWIAQWVARNANPETIVARRRHNWRRLDSKLSGRLGYRQVFTELPADCCPLVLPIWIDDNISALDRLQAAGVQAYVFGAIPHPAMDQAEYPESRRLSRQIIGLPVQQQLNDNQIDQVASIIEQYLVEWSERKVLNSQD